MQVAGGEQGTQGDRQGHGTAEPGFAQDCFISGGTVGSGTMADSEGRGAQRVIFLPLVSPSGPWEATWGGGVGHLAWMGAPVNQPSRWDILEVYSRRESLGQTQSWKPERSSETVSC